jgi:hypothetical protein
MKVNKALGRNIPDEERIKKKQGHFQVGWMDMRLAEAKPGPTWNSFLKGLPPL